MQLTPLESVPLYYRSPRLELRPYFPAEFKRLLDVGCGAGGFAFALKNDRGIEAWGIEIEPEPARLAQERLDKTFVGDCMQIFPTLPEGHFDLVTFNDVLEHLPRPWDTLREVRRVLSPSGSLVVSLPNIRYWEDFKRLAWYGDFPLEDSGIFDRTHLHFWTKKSIERFFAEQGWTIEQMGGIHPTLSKKLVLLNLLTGNRFADAKYLQWVVRAKPHAAAQL